MSMLQKITRISLPYVAAIVCTIAFMFPVAHATAIAHRSVHQGVSAQDKELLQRYAWMYQMWALSKNYQFGLTLPKNKVLAYAWLHLYVSSLPADYPGGYHWLHRLRQQISTGDIKASNRAFHTLQRRYRLNFRLQEADLQRVFCLRAMSPQVFAEKLPHGPLPSFKKILWHLRSHGYVKLAAQLQRYMHRAEQRAGTRFHIVYGQIHVLGIELPQYVSSEFPILSRGYFVALLPQKKKQVYFSLNGYATRTIFLHEQEKVQNLGRIYLRPLPHEQQAGLIGSLIPAPKQSDIGIYLHIAYHGKRNPWYTPTVPVTLLKNGQFYATGLTPTRYHLVIANAYHRVEKTVELTAGQTLNLGQFAL